MNHDRIYVSDLIGDDYTTWQPKDKILISTQTGSGKTSFMIRVLLPYAVRHNKYIAYICNRKTLRDQAEAIIETQIHDFYSDDPEFAEKCISKMIIRTYQSCEMGNEFPDFKSGYDEHLEIFNFYGTQNIMYYVFDEAHYFVQDALFNSSTNYWYDKLFDNGITVFLTATPEPLLIFLHRRLFDANVAINFRNALINYRTQKKNASIPYPVLTVSYYPDKGFSHPPKYGIEKRYPKYNVESSPYQIYFDLIAKALNDTSQLKIYGDSFNKTDYSYLNSYYFEEYNDLLDIIKHASSENKWVVFVDNEIEGKAIFNKLTEAKKDVAFISSATKPYKKFNASIANTQLIEKQSFDFDVLITTSVLDCGVNICDKAVKNIVVSSPDKTTFLQMLGRIRVDNQKINVHIKFYEGRKMNYRRHTYEMALEYVVKYSLLAETYLRYKQCNDPEKNDLYQELILKYREVKNLTNNRSNMRNIQLLYSHMNPKVDRSYSQGDADLQKQIILYDYSKSAMLNLVYSLYSLNRSNNNWKQDKLRFLYEQLSWIGHQYNENNWSVYELCRDELRNILEKNLKRETSMNQSEQQEFALECIEVMVRIPNILPKIKKLWTKLNNEKTEKVGKNILNKALVHLNLPYEITSKQKMINRDRQTIWCVEKLEPPPFN